MRSHRFFRLTGAAAAACGLALHLAAATAPGGDGDAGSQRMPWLSPGLRFQAPAPIGDRYATGEVRWQRQDESSQWFARVSMGPLHAADAGSVRLESMTAPLPPPLLQGEAQWLYRGWEGHDVRLGAQARHDLLLPPAQATALGAYVQDEWPLGADWRLAIGLRADGAPDVDMALTPRAALSWQVRSGVQLRLVDGVRWCDPQLALSPWQGQGAAPTSAVLASGVRLHATELALNWQVLPALRLSSSLHRQRDAQNVAAAVAAAGPSPAALRFGHSAASLPGDGVDVEGEFAADAGWRVRARWGAFQADADDERTATARVFAALQAHTPLPWRGASAGFEWLRLDQRAALPGAAALTQTLLNATLAWAPTGSPWRLAANAYNLADHPLVSAVGADLVVREGRRWQVQLARSY